MAMFTGRITALFDAGQVFAESYPIEAGTAADALRRLEQIAGARVRLLGKNVEIVALSVSGAGKKRVRMRGTSGAYARARESLNLYHNHQTTGRKLRGVPRELVQGYGFLAQMSARGRPELDCFNRALVQNGYRLVRPGRPVEAFMAFEPFRFSLMSYRMDAKAPLKKLIPILGEEAARAFWAERKRREAEQQAEVDAINGRRRPAQA